jgi:hypothetical protein
MRRIIPLLEDYQLNEMPGGNRGMSPINFRKLRATGIILKEFKQSSWMNGKDIAELRDAVYYAARDQWNPGASYPKDIEIIKIFFTEGSWNPSHKSTDTLASKASELVRNVLYADKDIARLLDEYNEAEAEKKRIAKEEEDKKRHAKELAEKEKEAKFVKSIPGFEEIFKWQKGYMWYVTRNPWGLPKFESKPTENIEQTNMKKGEYYIVDATYYSGSRGEGLMFGSIIQAVDEKRAKLVFVVGAYGQATWATPQVNMSEVDVTVYKAYVLKDWVKANKSGLDKVISSLEEKIDKWKKEGDYIPSFDPYWGMN